MITASCAGRVRDSRRTRGISVALLLLVAAVLCGSCTKKHPTQASRHGGPADDAARFLAGLKGSPESSFRTLEATEAWKRYAAEFDQTWTEVHRNRFAPVESFQQRELSRFRRGDFVFYPFSGPDVLYATHFYPEATAFVFAGLERVGSIRSAEHYSIETLDRRLRGWRWALSSIFERSFFVTSEMDRQFHGGVADGLLPLILLLLARTDCIIDGYEYRQLLDSGELVAEKDAPKLHQAVEVRFHRNEDPRPRTVYYFSTDLAAGFERNPAFERFLRQRGRPDTLVKSASFLLHWRMCQKLRSYILESSSSILQDDTGVPFRYLQSGEWKVSLYGEYSPPVRPFRRLFQPDLADAFHDPARVRELGFSLGYGAGRRPSSLMLAVRVKASS